MAKRRLLKFVLSLAILFVVLGIVAVVGAWMVVGRGPSVPDHSTLVLRMAAPSSSRLPLTTSLAS